MSSRSSIEWAETAWNPTAGCDRISAGCGNCYALTLAKRLKAMGSEKYQKDGDSRTSGYHTGPPPLGHRDGRRNIGSWSLCYYLPDCSNSPRTSQATSLP